MRGTLEAASGQEEEEDQQGVQQEDRAVGVVV